MRTDPIVENTRKAGEEFIAASGKTLKSVCRILRNLEKKHADRVVTKNPRKAHQPVAP